MGKKEENKNKEYPITPFKQYLKNLGNGVNYNRLSLNQRSYINWGDYKLTVPDYKSIYGYDPMKMQEQELLDIRSQKNREKLSNLLAPTDLVFTEDHFENVIKAINKLKKKEN